MAIADREAIAATEGFLTPREKVDCSRAVADGNPLAWDRDAGGAKPADSRRLAAGVAARRGELTCCGRSAFAIGREHAHPLRVLAMAIGWALPLLLTLAALLLPALAAIVLGCAAIACFLGVLPRRARRRLFVADATHTVTLFYGREAA